MWQQASSWILTALFIRTLLLGSPFTAWAQDLKLQVTLDPARRIPLFSIPLRTNVYADYQVQVSTNLSTWTQYGKFFNYLDLYADQQLTPQPPRFFRAVQLAHPDATNELLNQITDQSASFGKFLIFTRDPQRVYFHDSSLLHYDAASRHFPDLAALGPEAFDDKAIHPANQEIVLGGIVSPQAPLTVTPGLGIEFVSAEPYSPERLVELFKVVTNRMAFSSGAIFLLPTAVQSDTVVANLTYFASNGVPVRQWKEFVNNRLVQAEGWSVGVLKYIPSQDIDDAIATGQLTPDTILVTDHVPRDLPPIAGLISLTPSSPNSHTVIRLGAHSLPYYDSPVGLSSDITYLLGKRVLFSAEVLPFREFVDNVFFGPPVQTYLTSFDALPQQIQQELTSRQSAALPEMPDPIQRLGSYSKNTDTLRPSDRKYFGFKAANYGLLRKAIPESSEPAIALSFDLWLDFMTQTLPSGKTLQQAINEELSGATNNTSAPPHLQTIRGLIEHTAQFTDTQKSNIVKALRSGPFDPSRKLRFRSSSNAEDLTGFSAAGLYNSYSGCLLDDLRGTDKDICLCDPADDKARSVFRAIQKVYASFYNDQAFLERREYGIDEKNVGMAILVHHSFPDEEELANGVATVQGVSGPSPLLSGYTIVSQRGAVSVTNPEGPDLPESWVLRANGSSGISQFSTIPPAFTSVLGDEANYWNLAALFLRVGQAYVPSNQFSLDFEFKKTAAGFIVKQVRPWNETQTTNGTIVMPENLVFQTYQGGPIYANFETQPTLESTHRLKSRWMMNFTGGLTSDVSRGFGGLANIQGMYLQSGAVVTNTFAFATAVWITNNIIADWTHGTDATPSYGVIRNQFVSATTLETVNLDFLVQTIAPLVKPFISPENVLVQLSFPVTNAIAFTTNNITIRTVYTLGVHPNIPVVGLGPTSDLVQWKQTTISGLTSEPIELKGNFSQTYYASRHNFVEYFLFEPALEENLPDDSRAELQKADVKQIYFTVGGFAPYKIDLVGFDGRHRAP